MRQNFNVGQEIISEDLNTLQSRIERGIFDRIIYEILQKKSNGFFQGGLSVVYQSSTDIVVKAGLGFQESNTGTKEAFRKPIVVDADLTLSINSPDSSNPRIDLVCVKASRYNAESENRKYKDEFTDTITTQSMVVATDWKADVLIVAGTPAGSPTAPALPVGYMALAEILVAASTGIASQSSITDMRDLLPFAVSTSATGSSEYDAVVGDISQIGVTHSDLKSALDNASDGWKILVIKDETIDTIPVVLNNNIEIVFKRGITFTRGTATSGLQVNGSDCKILNARFSGFNTGGDKALKLTGNRAVIDSPRFLNCATNIEDTGTNTFVNVEYTE